MLYCLPCAQDFDARLGHRSLTGDAFLDERDCELCGGKGPCGGIHSGAHPSNGGSRVKKFSERVIRQPGKVKA